MRRLFSKTELQAFSSILALMLLLGTIPLTSGVAIVRTPSCPEITINICHPIQILNYASNNLLARPSVKIPQFVLFFQGSFKVTPALRVVERNVAPEIPPPKPVV
jgi:hypothetical protein